MKYFTILITDTDTGRGVPLVELKLPHGVTYHSDSNGVVAFWEQALMGKEIFFEVTSPGYEFLETHSGKRGKVLRPVAGNSTCLEVKRRIIAERLYRITGEGIYRDSILVRQPVPLRHSSLNAGVLGQDSVVVVVYRDRLYWFWGDTLGPNQINGKVTGAVSTLPCDGTLDPADGVDFNYFVDGKGFVQSMCPFPEGGRIWLDWVLVIPDSDGCERLVGHYSRVESLDRCLEQGIAIFDDKRLIFSKLGPTNLADDSRHRVEHPVSIQAFCADYILFTSGFRLLRVKPTIDDLLDPAASEGFSCLKPGCHYQKEHSQLDRDEQGRLRYGWKTSTDPIDYDRQQELIQCGKMKPHEGWLQLCDIDSGSFVRAVPGSIYWNDYRQRWVMIGSGDPGDIWYAEADTVVGPWVYCKKVAEHGHYNLYNPVHHPFLDQRDGRWIYFEGTYSHWFSDNPIQTPRYDYNQLMYRLRLDDPRLSLPVPIYRVRHSNNREQYLTRNHIESRSLWQRVEEIPFFALEPERAPDALIPIYCHSLRGGKPGVRFTADPSRCPQSSPLPFFYAIPSRTEPNSPPYPSIWHCRARDAFGTEVQFVLRIADQGSRPSVIIDGKDFKVIEEQIEESYLRFKIRYNHLRYTLSGRISQRFLAGWWRCLDASHSGEWKGERIDSAWRLRSSPFVVPLFEYRHRQLGVYRYSVLHNLDSSLWQRSAEPVCHVWRNPSSLIVIDPHTRHR